MQSAARFPVKLPIAVKSDAGVRPAETQNISANGVLFEVDADMPIGSPVDFTISLPADVVGAINVLERGYRLLACGEPAQSGQLQHGLHRVA